MQIMEKRMFHIKGRVIDHKTHRGIPGLRVEPWDKDLIYDDLVGSATTDEQGAFQITFDASYFKKLFTDRKPDLFFKVFFEDKEIHSTKDNVIWNFDNADEEITIEIDFIKLEPTVVEDIKALQRIIFIAPDLDTSFKLLNKGIKSVNQIAAIPEHIFISNFGSCFANTIEAKKSYNKAVVIGSSSGY
jgi:hypothetical protein